MFKTIIVTIVHDQTKYRARRRNCHASTSFVNTVSLRAGIMICITHNKSSYTKTLIER